MTRDDGERALTFEEMVVAGTIWLWADGPKWLMHSMNGTIIAAALLLAWLGGGWDWVMLISFLALFAYGTWLAKWVKNCRAAEMV